MSTWVPKDQRTAAWKIFNQKFMCTAPVFQMRSVEDIEHFGTPASGDAEFDATMMNERRLMYLSIAEMTELFKRGVVVGVRKVEDTKTIYDIIQEHLTVWNTVFLKSPNVKPDNEVLGDLIQLDKLANAVYQYAQFFFTVERLESIVGQRITSFQDTFMLPTTTAAAMGENSAVQIVNKKEWEPQPRQSLADIFAERRTAGSSWHSKGHR